jgi:hypothetical protein
MALASGALLMNRVQLPLAGGVTDVDTGLVQPDLAVNPNLATRVMVLPMAPTDNWGSITHANPTFSATTNTVHVSFTNGSGATTINVLFWDPHTSVGPVDADSYT